MVGYKWLSMVAVVVMVMVNASVASASIVLSLQPSSQSVAEGSQVTVDLAISGLSDPPSLGTFDLNIEFDPTLLSFSNFAFGDPTLGDQLDPTGGKNILSFVNPGVGTTDLFELSLDSASTLNALQASGFTLGVLTFDTIGIGTSELSLSINALGDAEGNSLSATLQNGSVSVASSTVPEPSPLTLLGCAVVLAGLLKMYSPRALCHFSYISRLRTTHAWSCLNFPISVDWMRVPHSVKNAFIT